MVRATRRATSHTRTPRARHRHSEWRPERGPQRRSGRGARRDHRLHGRRHSRRSGVALAPRTTVPELGRRRLGRPKRRTARRSVGRAVRCEVARRSDAGPLHRPHRRARARLQHGVPPQRAARDRRVQPGLSQGRRRRRRLLAAAGEGAGRSAFRPPRSSGITIVRRSRPIGASRLATAKARPGSTRITRRSSSAAP